MAFQTGTQVRPELGRADVSGFARGGELIAAGIGAGLRNFIEGQEKVKKINNATDALTEGVKSNQYLQALLGLTDQQVQSDALKPAVKKFVKGLGADKAMALGAQLNLAVINKMIDRDKVSPKVAMDLKKYLDDKKLVIEDGRLVYTKGINKVLDKGDPRVINLIRDIEGGEQLLYGYEGGTNIDLVSQESEEDKKPTPPPSVFKEMFPEDEPSMTRDLTFDIGVAGPFAPRQYLGL